MTISISSCDRFRDAIEFFQPSNKKEWAALGISCAALLFSSGAAIASGVGYFGYKWATAEKLPNPNTVQTIYTPPHESESLVPYAKEITALKKDPSVMGIAFARDEEGCLTPIYIRCVSCNDYTMHFYAYKLINGDRLGFAIVHPFLESNGYLKEGYWLCGRPEGYEGYGSSREEVGKVLLDQVTNDSKYKNIGVILNKAIHQKFEKECQGRMFIEAARNTHPYHYKLGFRAADSQQNRLYASYVRRHEIPKRGLGSVQMHLPERARELWLEEIRQHPIGFFS